MRRSQFDDIEVLPYSDLLDNPFGGKVHKGGPDYPDFDALGFERHNRGGAPIDDRPDGSERRGLGVRKATFENPFWIGPVCGHFGHQIADFSHRILPSLEMGASHLVASGKPADLQKGLRPFFTDLLEYLGADPASLVVVGERTVFRKLGVVEQAQQVGRMAEPGYCEALRAVQEKRFGSAVRRERIGYVSRSALPIATGRVLGEKYLEARLAANNVDIIHPQTMPLREQLAFYVTHCRLLFMEGSALHALELLGSLGEVTIISRRTGSRVFGRVSDRTAALEHIDELEFLGSLAPNGALARGTAVLKPAGFEALTRRGFIGGYDYSAYLDVCEDELAKFVSNEFLMSLWPDKEGYIAKGDEITTKMQQYRSTLVSAADETTGAIAEKGANQMTDWSVERLNRIATIIGARKYLEIGVESGSTFREIQVANRVAVDPNFRFDPERIRKPGDAFFEIASDEYFSSHADGDLDLIFIDGLHQYQQVLKDFLNSLARLSPKGVMVIDDVLPSDVYSAEPDQSRAIKYRHASGNASNSWHGDVYKLIFFIHHFMPSISYRTFAKPGNYQTVCWREGRVPTSTPCSLHDVQAMSYFDMMENIDVFHIRDKNDIYREIEEKNGKFD